MQIHNVVQGSPEWHALRAKFYTASEAPAMMGVSKYQSRNELLALKKYGIEQTVDGATQSRFDKGHAAEAAIRPHIEKIIGEDLYPVTASEGDLLASMDGLTMTHEIVFEHKHWNDALAKAVKAGQLDEHYKWQLDQQLFVARAKRAIFVVSDGTPEKCVYLTYFPDPDRFEQLHAGWVQFDKDLADFVMADAAPAVVAAPVESLPALLVELTGHVKSSNLTTYRDIVSARIQAINTNLQTDQDFADAEKIVKFLGDGEKEIEAVKKQALAQTPSIDELFRTVDQLCEEMRAKRLELEKIVKARKDSIRVEIQSAAGAAGMEHVDQINATLGGKIKLPIITSNFAGVMKGKKTVASLRSAVDDELARFKIEANRVADKIRLNLQTLRTDAVGFESLFPDAQTLVLKEPEDLSNLIKLRISEHKAEQERIAEKVRQEERAKIEREQAEKDRLERERIERETAIKAQLATASTPEPTPPSAAPAMPRPAAPVTDDRVRIINIIADVYGISTQAAERLILAAFGLRNAA